MIEKDIQKLLIRISGVQKDVSETDEKALKEEIDRLKKEKQSLNMLLKDRNLQQTYPTYLKQYKFFSLLPNLSASVLSILTMILLVLLIDFFTYPLFISFIPFLVGFITYMTLEKYSTKQLDSIANLKKYYDELGDKPFDKEKVEKMVQELAISINKATEKLNNHNFRLRILDNWHKLERKLLDNLTNDNYNTDLTTLSSSLTELDTKELQEKPEEKIYREKQIV